MGSETIGSRLKKLRQSVKMPQRKMGELLGVSQSAIDRYERDTASPSAQNFVVYADYFDVSLDYIFGRCDDPQGKLYEHRPRVEQGNPDLKLFAVGMQLKVLVGLGILFLTIRMLPNAADYVFVEMKRMIVSFVEAMT